MSDFEQDNEESVVDIHEQEIILPNGVLTSDGAWIRRVELAELDGTHERILRNGHYRRDGVVAQKLLESVILKLGDIEDPKAIAKLVPKMTLADATYLIVQLRWRSLGPKFEFKAQCAHCDEFDDYVFDMSKMSMTSRFETDPPESTYTVDMYGKELVHTGPMSIEAHNKLLRFRRQDQEHEGDFELFLLTVSVDGNKPGSWKDFERWPQRYRNLLRDSAMAHEYGYDVTIENMCRACQRMFEGVLPVMDRRFFFQSERTKS